MLPSGQHSVAWLCTLPRAFSLLKPSTGLSVISCESIFKRIEFLYVDTSLFNFYLFRGASESPKVDMQRALPHRQWQSASDSNHRPTKRLDRTRIRKFHRGRVWNNTDTSVRSLQSLEEVTSTGPSSTLSSWWTKLYVVLQLANKTEMWATTGFWCQDTECHPEARFFPLTVHTS